MNIKEIRTILNDTDYVRTGGTEEELRCAEYLKSVCEGLGAQAHLEEFPVQMAVIRRQCLLADGIEIPCKGYYNCGSGTVTAPFLYLPNTDPASLTSVSGKIVLLDSGVTHFLYQDLIEAGCVGIITATGDVNFRDRDIDQKELRAYARGDAPKILCANINVKDAEALVRRGVRKISLTVEEDEYEGVSRNVVAVIPGASDEWISLTAHYDSTSLSHGAYDNMTGCIGLIGIMEDMLRSQPNRYGLRFIFCGSEERGLLGSKAYTAAHEDELKDCVLNINLDMIGTYMGKFISCVSAEDKLVGYIQYLCSEIGFGINVRSGVYSSDSTPFADHGVPAVSFARIAPNSYAPIHNRYDTKDVVSPSQTREDIEFLAYFTDRMANAIKCPVKREIPESVRTELDEYLNRKRKNA